MCIGAKTPSVSTPAPAPPPAQPAADIMAATPGTTTSATQAAAKRGTRALQIPLGGTSASGLSIPT
jgi:hypothetical protein